MGYYILAVLMAICTLSILKTNFVFRYAFKIRPFEAPDLSVRLEYQEHRIDKRLWYRPLEILSISNPFIIIKHTE